MRWAAEKKTSSERRFLKVTPEIWKKAHAAFEALLPKEDDQNARLFLFAKIAAKYPTGKITCRKVYTPSRKGKSIFYEQYKKSQKSKYELQRSSSGLLTKSALN